MHLQDLLKSDKKRIVDAWYNGVMDSYPAETAQLLRKQQDRFRNPIGANTRQTLDALFDLLAGPEPASVPDVQTAIDPLIRIRAVQNFTPPQAVGFIFDFKKIIRSAVRTAPADAGLQAELTRLDDRIDHAMLAAFELYVKCREQIYDLKVHNERNQLYRALARAGLVSELPPDRPQAIDPDEQA